MWNQFSYTVVKCVVLVKSILDLDRVFLRYMSCILRVNATISDFIVTGAYFHVCNSASFVQKWPQQVSSL